MRQRRAPTGEQPLAGSLSMMKPCPSHSAASSFRSARKPRISSFLMRPATSFGSPISTVAAPSCLSSTSWTPRPADASNYVSCGTTGRPSRSTASHCSALIPGARAAIKSSKALTSFRFPCWLTREERLLFATVRAGFLSNGRSTVSGSTGEFGSRSGACRLPRGSWGPSRTLPFASPRSMSPASENGRSQILVVSLMLQTKQLRGKSGDVHDGQLSRGERSNPECGPAG